tara:strand:+ start:732 stop:1232 length:501 start_codon:yes stop_codon:yes gene_type:complete
MKKYINIVIALIFAFCISSCQKQDAYVDYEEYELTLILPETKAIEIEVLELINEHRVSLNLNQLQTMPILKSVANRHTRDMIRDGKYSHSNFYLRSEYIKFKTNAATVSENVAYGYSNASSLVNAWVSSGGHRRNIESNSTHFDISIEPDINGRFYATNIFIRTNN